LENEARNAVTVNGVRYRNMIVKFCGLNWMVWIWKTYGSSRTAQPVTPRETTELLREKFPGHVISHGGDQNWPPRSCDLTPCYFFLWGFVKCRVYANKLQTNPELKAEIQCVIGEIELQLCGNVIKNFVKRARVCQQSCGEHLSDIVFHN
jgi:hypothetical protein